MLSLPEAPGNIPGSPFIVTLDGPSARYVSPSVRATLDYLGECSAGAQGLSAPITTTSRLSTDPTQRVYIALASRTMGEPLGFLKVGQRALYLTVPPLAAYGRFRDPSTFVASLKGKEAGGDRGGGRGGGSRLSASGRGAGSSAMEGTALGGSGSMWECNPLCVLDFFVDEKARRRGVGRALLECMMRTEGVVHPAVMAFDRPSPMFLSFLTRHYSLRSFTPQANNYVLYDAFFGVAKGTIAPLDLSTGEGGVGGRGEDDDGGGSRPSSAPTPQQQQQQMPQHHYEREQHHPRQHQPSSSYPPSPSYLTHHQRQQQQLEQQQQQLQFPRQHALATQQQQQQQQEYPTNSSLPPLPPLSRGGSAGGSQFHPQLHPLTHNQQQQQQHYYSSTGGSSSSSGSRGGFDDVGDRSSGGGGGSSSTPLPPLADHIRVLRLSTAPSSSTSSSLYSSSGRGGGHFPYQPSTRAPGAGMQWTGGGREGGDTSPFDPGNILTAPHSSSSSGSGMSSGGGVRVGGRGGNHAPLDSGIFGGPESSNTSGGGIGSSGSSSSSSSARQVLFGQRAPPPSTYELEATTAFERARRERLAGGRRSDDPYQAAPSGGGSWRVGRGGGGEYVSPTKLHERPF